MTVTAPHWPARSPALAARRRSHPKTTRMKTASTSRHSPASKNAIAGGSFLPLVGPGGALADTTLAQFQSFLAGCVGGDPNCLPPQEIAIVDRMLLAAGVISPTRASAGPDIAAYEGQGDRTNEAALFAPTGQVTPAELLARSVAARGPWLGINLDQSPVKQQAAQDCAPTR